MKKRTDQTFNGKQLTCEKCGKTFTLIESFNRHYPTCRRPKAK